VGTLRRGRVVSLEVVGPLQADGVGIVSANRWVHLNLRNEQRKVSHLVLVEVGLCLRQRFRNLRAICRAPE
jgi:hypothetical protein